MYKFACSLRINILLNKSIKKKLPNQTNVNVIDVNIEINVTYINTIGYLVASGCVFSNFAKC